METCSKLLYNLCSANIADAFEISEQYAIHLISGVLHDLQSQGLIEEHTFKFHESKLEIRYARPEYAVWHVNSIYSLSQLTKENAILIEIFET